MTTKTFDSGYINGELKKVDGDLQEPVVVYVLGGFVMIKSALKSQTKDIDVVTEGQRSVDALLGSLRSLMYSEPELGERGKEYVMIENRDAFRWDIFDTKIAGKLVLSDKMKERAIGQFKGRMLTALALSREDVFLLKAVADREVEWERDMEDMALLAGTGLNYDVVLEECMLQSNLTGEFWEATLYDRCIELGDDYDVRVSILGRLKKIVEERRGR